MFSFVYYRVVGFVLLKMMSVFLMGVQVHQGQLEMVRQATLVSWLTLFLQSFFRCFCYNTLSFCLGNFCVCGVCFFLFFVCLCEWHQFNWHIWHFKLKKKNQFSSMTKILAWLCSFCLFLQRDIPVIILPMHRSHLDYILMSFILHIYGIRVPFVAAGDNLNIPVFR